jgi:hypothetical protein
MTKTSKYLVPAIIATGLFFAMLLGVIVSQTPKTALGSVSIVDVYKSTTTRATSGEAASSFMACKGQCVVGSIVVVQPATAGYVQLWDATSTATSTYSGLRDDTSMASGTPYTTLGRPITSVLGSSDVVGTLTFDLGTIQGLVVETSDDFNGEYVLTYKK